MFNRRCSFCYVTYPNYIATYKYTELSANASSLYSQDINKYEARRTNTFFSSQKWKAEILSKDFFKTVIITTINISD